MPTCFIPYGVCVRLHIYIYIIIITTRPPAGDIIITYVPRVIISFGRKNERREGGRVEKRRRYLPIATTGRECSGGGEERP